MPGTSPTISAIKYINATIVGGDAAVSAVALTTGCPQPHMKFT